MQVSEHFGDWEFFCKCHGHYPDCTKLHPNGIPKKLLELLEDIRVHFNQPVTVDSGFRCHGRNEDVRGEDQSQHLLGTAADIRVRDISPDEVLEYARKILKGKGGLGAYTTFTHIDVRKGKSRWDFR